MTVKRAVDKPIKHRGKGYKVKELIKELNIKGDLDIVSEKSWFSDAMNELEKQEKEKQ